MSQYADGGWIATKPYVSSANYMKKMGDYCDQCHYNQKLKQMTTVVLLTRSIGTSLNDIETCLATTLG
jgi:hypothetical protein